jgi:hypothetical protein
MKKTSFYIIKDQFFEDMPDPYLKGNKAGNLAIFSISLNWMTAGRAHF